MPTMQVERTGTAAALAARSARAAFKSALKRGEVDLRVALEQDIAQGMRTADLVAAMPFSRIARAGGPSRPARHGARRVCEIARISEGTPVRELGREDRDALTIAYMDYHRVSRA